MPKQLPLNYAILKLFQDGDELDVDAVMDALKDNYGKYHAYKSKAVEESLMSAEKNGLLECSGFELDAQYKLHVFYHVTDYGTQMITKYI